MHKLRAVTTGTVTFKDGNTVIAGPMPLNANGTASVTATSLSVGSHTIKVTYAGGANYQDSSDSLTQFVRR